MQWTTEQKDGISLVRCQGRFDANDVDHFKKKIGDMIKEGRHKLVFNLQGISFIDSSGLGALISCLRQAHQRQGVVKLCGLNQEVRLVFEVTRLHKVFDIFQDEACALEDC